MSPLELVLTALGEVTNRTNDSNGMNELIKDAHDGGEIASITRKNIENKTGKPIVTSKNAVDFKRKKAISNKL